MSSCSQEEKKLMQLSFHTVAVSEKVGLLCVRMHDNKKEKERVKRTFLSHSHSPPPHPHCYSLPPHPQFPSCAFFRVYWMFFPHPATKPAFLCHNLTAWCSVVQLLTCMVKRVKWIETLLTSYPLSRHLTIHLGSITIGWSVSVKGKKISSIVWNVTCKQCPVTIDTC